MSAPELAGLNTGGCAPTLHEAHPGGRYLDLLTGSVWHPNRDAHGNLTRDVTAFYEKPDGEIIAESRYVRKGESEATREEQEEEKHARWTAESLCT